MKRFVQVIGGLFIAGCIASCSTPRGPGALANTLASPVAASIHDLPKIETRASAGFRIYRPGYRLSGNGALVTAQLCRLPGWAGQGPAQFEVARIASGGGVIESHINYLPQLSMHVGNNCTSAAVKLEHVPDYGQKVRICAVSGRLKCQ